MKKGLVIVYCMSHRRCSVQDLGLGHVIWEKIPEIWKIVCCRSRDSWSAVVSPDLTRPNQICKQFYQRKEIRFLKKIQIPEVWKFTKNQITCTRPETLLCHTPPPPKPIGDIFSDYYLFICTVTVGFAIPQHS